MSVYQSSFVYTRKSPRIPLELTADIRVILPGKGLEHLSLNIKYLSDGGLSFLSPILLPVGTQVEMTLYDLRLRINFTAKVIWINQAPYSENNTYRCGLEITHISDEDSLKIHCIVNRYLGISVPPASF